MGTPASALPTGWGSTPFTTRAAIQRGVSVSRLRGADLVTPVRGVRILRDAVTLESRCHAFLKHRPRDVVFSHFTAALLFGAPLPGWAERDQRIHVTVRSPGRAPNSRGFAGHKLSDWRPASAKGLPVTDAAQTWMDLAPLLPPPALVAVGDFLVTTPATGLDLQELRHRVATSKRRRGIATARRLVESIRVGPESPQESRLRLLLLEHGLPEPVLQFEVRSASGAFLGRADLAYPRARLLLEYEGDVHRVDREVWLNDIGRRERLEDAGWRVLRVTATDLDAPSELLDRTRRALARSVSSSRGA